MTTSMNREPPPTHPSHVTHVRGSPTLRSERMFSSTMEGVTVPTLAVQFLKLNFQQTCAPGDQSLAAASHVFKLLSLLFVSFCAILE